MLSALLASVVAAAPTPSAAVQPPPAVTNLSLKALSATVGKPIDAAQASLSAPGYPLTCAPASGADAAAGAQTCRFGRRYGAFVEPPTLSLDGRYRIDHLRFTVVGGQVASITFETSPDRYDDLLQRLQDTFGAPEPPRRHPVETAVGERPGVHVAWSGPGRHVALDAPAPPRFDLRVTITDGRTPGARTPA